MELTTDYLVVGAGASGLVFADTLIAESDADVLLVDQRHEPGAIGVTPTRSSVCTRRRASTGSTREAWFNDRRTAQPLDLIGDTIESLSLAAEITAGGCDPDTMLTQFEDAGQVMRLDQRTVPTMYRGSMLSIAEVERLKSITDVVRLGRLTRDRERPARPGRRRSDPP